ncbi:MAG: sulfotransferase family protein [Tunicatimonas sp.]|uniref:sulfotransferase-like domain-containing protein n=1 Tax=Tunicatimonas sp. TaxID=1940096 RepID=UPI003C7444C9
MKRIHLISNPRNLSTALMYSFAQRSDTQVVDEPFYGYYLTQRPNVNHPGKEDILTNMKTNSRAILEDVVFGNYNRPVLFIKNMAHHLVDLDYRFTTRLTNLFLIRNPKQLISSIAQNIQTPTMEDIGSYRQYKMYQFLQNLGIPSVVLDSGELLKDPLGVLQKLCVALDLPFEKSMLSWEPKPLPEDGIWARYWYRNVHQSTGFSQQPTSNRPLPAHLEELYKTALLFYNKLHENAIQA